MKNVYEIFEEFEKLNTNEERVNYLRNNGDWTLKNILRGIFHPKVQFIFDEMPEYKVSDDPPGLAYGTLHHEMGRIYIFVKNSPKVDPNLTQARKKEILIQMLEQLEAKEAKVLEGLLMKNLKVKGLNYELVKDAFPELLP